MRPVESLEDLKAAFQEYLRLKEELLEETDYTWFTRYMLMGSIKEEMKGYRTRDLAEQAAAVLKAKNIKVDLEKKVKKSGAMKLSKAFAISTKIIEDRIDPEACRAWYKVRAEAPNGQFVDRAGYCDGRERGKAGNPFDTIDATALTRATDRAIMSLLGGENTAEEFPEPVDQAAAGATAEAAKPPAKTYTLRPQPAAQPTPAPAAAVPVPPVPPAAPAPEPAPEEVQLVMESCATCMVQFARHDLIAVPAEDGGFTHLCAACHEIWLDTDSPLDAPGEPKTKEQLIAEMDAKFATGPAAPPHDKTNLVRRAFALAHQAKIEADAFKDGVKERFNLASFNDATEEQLEEAITYLKTEFNLQ